MSAYGVYVHLPWCARRCHYCSFNVHVDEERPERAYTNALLEQWEGLRAQFEGAPETLAFGGGTPSLHEPALLAELVDAIAPTGEVSIEANPESMNAQAWLDLGVTRVSLGVQTFDGRYIRFLNRHSADQARRAIAAITPFESWSIDLIFGLPGQTIDDLDHELDALLEHDPPHASLYGLTVHPDTAYARTVAAGRHRPVSDDSFAELYERAAERLVSAGLERYEVSNFARPGHRSQHNLHYWRDRHYAGLGAGAHGFLPDGSRTIGKPDPAVFIAAPLDMDVERPSPEQAALDRLLSGIRHTDGVDAAPFDPETLEELERAGLVAVDPNVRLIGRGWSVADSVTKRLAFALPAAS